MRLLALVFVLAACHRTFMTPPELCARDGMVLIGMVGNHQQCRLPASPAEGCTVFAYQRSGSVRQSSSAEDAEQQGRAVHDDCMRRIPR